MDMSRDETVNLVDAISFELMGMDQGALSSYFDEGVALFRYFVIEDAINESTIATDEERLQAHDFAKKWVDEVVRNDYQFRLYPAIAWAKDVAQSPLASIGLMINDLVANKSL
jgi:hypothetical protein